MSAGPQVQLAVLWPWLLMATLQAGLGQTGLALAAAVESERAAAQKAIIRVIPLKVEPIILEGEFANVAEVTPAEGKLLQVRAAMLDPAPAASPPASSLSPLSLLAASAPRAMPWVPLPAWICPVLRALSPWVWFAGGRGDGVVQRAEPSFGAELWLRLIAAELWMWSADSMEIISYLN